MRTLTLALAIGASSAMAAAQGGPPPTRPDSTAGDTGRAAQRLPTRTILEEREELSATFLRRSRIRGTGKFLTSKEIEALHAPHTPQLLARVSGGDIRDIGNGTSVIVGSRGTRMTMLGSTPNQLCIIGLAINDTRVPTGFDLRGLRQEDISAIEFYNGPSSIPLDLAGTLTTDANCGLFVIWLKERRRPR